MSLVTGDFFFGKVLLTQNGDETAPRKRTVTLNTNIRFPRNR
jgi:hypothetical protein